MSEDLKPAYCDYCGRPSRETADQLPCLCAAEGQHGEARPAREERPKLPVSLAYMIQSYGDSRADDGKSEVQLGNLVSALRDWGAALATQAAPEAPPLSSKAPDNNAPAPMALSSGDTLRELLREAREYVVGHRPPMHCVDEHIVVNTMIRRIDAALADGGAK